MARGVAGHVDHLEVPAEQPDDIAVGVRHESPGDALARRAVHRRAGHQPGTQPVDAADMVRVVVRH